MIRPGSRTIGTPGSPANAKRVSGSRSRPTMFVLSRDGSGFTDRISWLEDLDARGKTVVITLDPELEAALSDAARRQGIAPEVLAVNTLRARFLPGTLQPRDERARAPL